jgi:hypothetical protein
VTERKRPEGLARLASAANATTESGAKRRRRLGQGGEAWARKRRSLRSPSGRLIGQRREIRGIYEEWICDVCGRFRTVVECDYPASEFELEID